jgi:hypothetical protein
MSKGYNIYVPTLLQIWDERNGPTGPSPEMMGRHGIDPKMIELLREKGDFTYSLTSEGDTSNTQTTKLLEAFRSKVEGDGYTGAHANLAFHTPINMAYFLGLDHHKVTAETLQY